MSSIFLKKKGGNLKEFLDTENNTISSNNWLSQVSKNSNENTIELETNLKKIFDNADQTGGASKKKRKSKGSKKRKSRKRRSRKMTGGKKRKSKGSKKKRSRKKEIQ